VLTNVTIPNTVLSIGTAAFCSCLNLASVTIPNSVRSLEGFTFAGCLHLASVVIGSGVTDVTGAEFAACQSLTSVCFQGDAPEIAGINMFNDDPLAAIFYVSGTTGWGPTFQGIPTVACAQCGVGALVVTITPSAAADAGAEWQVDGGPWETSGAVDNLAAGSHIVTFSNISGWITPSNQVVTVTNGFVTSATGDYMAASGSLCVTIGPPDAVAAGAQWQVDGGAWQSSGATVSGLSPASHTVSFSVLSGWTAPPAQEVTISAGGTVAATGIYVQQVAPAQVVLAFNVEGKNLVLSWSTNLTGFELQSATNLPAWASVPLAPAVCGTNYVVTNAIAGGSSFFRLKK
jgi:hypothetical protein